MSAAKPLRFVGEREALAPTALEGLQQPASPPGVYATLEPCPDYCGYAAYARLLERSAGPVRPEPHYAWNACSVEVCRVAEVTHLPGYGLMTWSDGSAPKAPAGGLPSAPDRFAEAPGVTRAADGFAFEAPADAPVLGAAGVFMPWGGRFNYGHFLIDALPSLLALEEADLTVMLPLIAPPLKRWQRELLALFGAPAVREVAAPVVRLRQAAYATSMEHFLHAPNALLTRTRARLLKALPPSPIRAERVYLSRRSHAHPMRVFLNEVELERALARRGFTIVRPERFSPGEQLALLRQARVVVGPSGAGLANALACEPGTLVVDVQPQTFPGAWVGAFGELIGHDWWMYYAPAPAPLEDTPWIRRMRKGFRFAYQVPLDDFLTFLDQRL